MPERPQHIPDTELEQLLTDTGRWIAYPTTPDFSRAFEAQPATTTNGLAPTDDREVWRPPTRRMGIHAGAAPVLDDRRRSRMSQAFRVAGAAAAFAIIGLTLVLLFRELDDGGQAGGGVPSPPPTEPLLIAVSSEGPVTAIEPATGTVRYTINGGYQPDAILSPDGTRLYVAGDDLTAHDAATGAEIWRVEYRYRLHWTIDTAAPSTLAISPDGSRLYIASYDQERGTSPDANTIPHFIQTFDTATGTNLGETEAIRGGCTVPVHPAPDGQRLHAPCDGRYSVYELPSGTLQPPPPGHAVIIASAQHDDELYLVTSAGIVQIVDMRAVAVVRDGRLALDGQVSPNLAALSPDGSRLYLGVSTLGERFFADQMLEFDTDTWQQVAQFTLEEPLTNRSLAVDADSAVYAASTSFVEGTSLPVSSTIWRADSASGTFQPVASLAAQEVAHVLLGDVPIADREPELSPTATEAAPVSTMAALTPTVSTTPQPSAIVQRSPTAAVTPTLAPTHTPTPPTTETSSPTVDTSAAAVEAALATLPAESRGCQATPGNAGDFGWEIAGVTLIGEGQLWLNMVGGDADYVLPPVQAGRSITTYWNIGGPNAASERFVMLTATELGAGTQIEADSRQPAGTSPFREGTVWRAGYTFPHAGCWQVIVQRPDYVGVLWLTVEDAP
jgi:hypothetical protein